MKIVLLLLIALSVTSANLLALRELIAGNNQFASSVYKELTLRPEENFLVSPLSAHLIVTLSQSGAGYETGEELRNALRIPHCKYVVNEAVETLLKTLHQDPNYGFQLINKIYVKKDYEIKDDFNATARNSYDAEIENLEFSCKYQAAKTINQWVEDETEGKITDLIDPEILSNKTRAVLVNALRLKANWTTPFQYFATTKREFISFDTVAVVDTMRIYDEEFVFYEKPDLNATFLELPLEGDNVTMTIALPNDIDGLPLLEQRIGEVLEAPVVTDKSVFDVVALPQFKIESRIDFKDILQNLGVKRAFKEGEADFSGIAGKKGELFINDIVQKSFIEVDREGIEAAAATYIVKIGNRYAKNSRDFIVNHPFIFYVKVSDVIVFLGRVILP